MERLKLIQMGGFFKFPRIKWQSVSIGKLHFRDMTLSVKYPWPALGAVMWEAVLMSSQ